MLTRLETNSLLRVMLGAFEADRCVSRPLFFQRMILICIQLRRHPDCTVAMCSTISAAVSAKIEHGYDEQCCAKKHLRRTAYYHHIPSGQTLADASHASMRRNMDGHWRHPHRLVSRLAAANKADEIDIQIQAGEQAPGVCTCNANATCAVTPHPCSACGRTLVCKALVVSGLGLISCKACKRKDDKRSGGSVPETRVRRGVTSRLKKECEMAGCKAGSAEYELAIKAVRVDIARIFAEADHHDQITYTNQYTLQDKQVDLLAGEKKPLDCSGDAVWPFL